MLSWILTSTAGAAPPWKLTVCEPAWTRHRGDIKASEVSVPQTSIGQACGVLGDSGPLPSPLGTCFFQGSRRPSF